MNRWKIRRIIAAAVALLLLSALPAAAGRRTIDEKRTVKSDARIVVDNLSGSITVTGWDRDEVEIRGELDEKAQELKIEGDRDELEIRVKYPRKKNLNIREGSELILKVPRGCSLDLSGVSCEVEVRDVRGELASSTVSGDVLIQGKNAGVEIASVSGDVTVDGESPSVTVDSVSGYVEVEGVKERLEISIVSGNADVDADALDELRFNAVSGDLDLRGEPAGNAHWELDCHSGDLTLELPGGLNAEFDISLFSGDLRNDFGPKAERTSKHGPGKELRFTAGKGGARIDITTFSGDIRLVKR